VDPRPDGYTLSLALNEALTGHLPHESDNAFVSLQAMMDGREPKPMEMLRKHPDERYQRIEKVKAARVG